MERCIRPVAKRELVCCFIYLKTAGRALSVDLLLFYLENWKEERETEHEKVLLRLHQKQDIHGASTRLAVVYVA